MNHALGRHQQDATNTTRTMYLILSTYYSSLILKAKELVFTLNINPMTKQNVGKPHRLKGTTKTHSKYYRRNIRPLLKFFYTK